MDILTLSIGPDEPPQDTLTFLSIFDISLLFARKAGVFVVQAAGNKGPAPSTVVSFSPWTVGVAASSTDRRYPASLLLGNGQILDGVGLTGSSGQSLYPPIFCLCLALPMVTVSEILTCRTKFWKWDSFAKACIS